MAKEAKKEEEKFEMEYRMLGGTGLKVSTLSFGFWATYGVKEGVDRCIAVLRICRKHGINFFDNAETYGKNPGDAEKIMGEAITTLRTEDPMLWRRSDIIITTKIFWGGSGVNELGLSRKHILEATEKSLKNLQTDYIDVIYCHRSDVLTSTEEVVRSFTHLIRSGKALYWGTSEWSAQQITEAYWIAKVEKLIPPVVEQPQYNMFFRENFEKQLLPLYKAPYNLGTTIWSPLAQGVLTGKYNKEIPKDSRFSVYDFLRTRFEKVKAEQIPKVIKLTEYAKKTFNTSVTVLAIAWTLKNKNVSTCLLGATKEEQINENLKALNLAKLITQQHMDEIDKILENKPAPNDTFRRELKNITNPL